MRMPTQVARGMRQPAFAGGRGAMTSRTKSRPAPVGGWNVRDSLADMPLTDAVMLDNFWPTPSDVRLRNGYSPYNTGYSAAVKSLMSYQTPAGIATLFAASDTGFYTVTSGALVANYGSFPAVAGNTFTSPNVSITGNFTLTMVVALTDYTPAADVTLVDKSAANDGFIVKWLTTDKVRLVIGDGASLTNVDMVAATSFANSSQHTVAIAWQDGVGATFSLDGAASAQVAAAKTLTNAATVMTIGSATSAGKIYSVGIATKYGWLASDWAVTSTNGATQASSTTGEIWTLNTSGGSPAAIVGSKVVVGLTNALWDSVNFTNSSGSSYLVCMNGVDAPRYWNGTDWLAVTGVSTIAITGVTTTKLKAPMVFKRRLWAIEAASLKAWYLPVDAVGGAAAVLDLSGIARRGGSLVALGNWTIDGGEGVDDYWVAVTSEGEVIVYKGTDPDSEVSWTLQGVWQLGEPIGDSRCLLKFAGDVLYNSSAGVVPLSKALQSSLTNERVAVSDKIQGAMQAATEAYGTLAGWCLMFYPGAQMLLINVPTRSTTSDQYVMNTVTQAWSRFKDIFATCWVVHDGIPYFGSSTFVGKFWQVTADNDLDIVGDVAQAYDYFDARGRLKSWSMCRPIILADSTPAVAVVLNVDFLDVIPTLAAGFTGVAGGVWDAAVWDGAVWGGDLNVYRDWQTISGAGIAASLRMRITAKGIKLRWQSTDWVFEVGGVL